MKIYINIKIVKMDTDPKFSIGKLYTAGKVSAGHNLQRSDFWLLADILLK